MRLWASMNSMNWSVRGQLLYLAILLTLPSLAIIIYAGFHERREAFRMAAIESQRLADNIFAEQQYLVASAHQLGKVIAELPEVQNGNAAKMQPILANLIKINPQFQSIVIVDINGNEIASAIPTRQKLSFADRRFFKNAVATGRFSSGEYVLGKHTGKPTIPVGYPLINKEGKLCGVVGLDFNLKNLEELLQRSQLPPHANYIITDFKGVVLTRGHDPAGFVGNKLRQERFEQMRRGPDKDTMTFTRIDGDKRIGTYRKLWIEGEKDPYMYVLAGQSVGEIGHDACKWRFCAQCFHRPGICLTHLWSCRTIGKALDSRSDLQFGAPKGTLLAIFLLGAPETQKGRCWLFS